MMQGTGQQHSAVRMTIDDIGGLPVMSKTDEAAALFGVSVDHLWALVREGRAPIEPVKLGRAYRWPTAKLLALAGLDTQPTSPSTRNEPPAGTESSITDPIDAATHSRRSGAG